MFKCLCIAEEIPKTESAHLWNVGDDEVVLCKDFSIFFAFLTVMITTILDISTARFY